MANCPFRNNQDIIRFYKSFLKKNSKSMISHVEPKFFNPWWSVKVKKNKIYRLNDFAYKKRSQDLLELLCPTGAIWLSDYETFLKNKTFYSKNYDYEIIDWKNGIDIDTIDELEISKNL